MKLPADFPKPRWRRPRCLRLWRLLADTARDAGGASVMVVALSLSAVIGSAALATEVASWYLTSRTMQGAADAAAVSAAIAKSAGGSTTQASTEAKTVAANYQFVDGTGGVTVTVNQPPSSGGYPSTSAAVEVIIQQPQTRLLTTLFISSDPTILARAVATPGTGSACVLALDPTASGAMSAGGSTAVNLVNCAIGDDSNSATALSLSGGGTISTSSAAVVGGISGGSSLTTTNGSAVTGSGTIADPYKSLAIPSYSGCNQNNPSAIHNTTTWDAGGGTYVICNGVSVNASGILNLSNGVFIIDRGGLSLAGSATLNVTNATVILTSSTGSNWGTVSVGGGATVNATAPTSGSTAGIAFYGDRSAPSGTNTFTGGAGQSITGAIYFPSQTVSYTGGTATGTGCTQVVADMIAFSGTSSVEINCTGTGVKPIYLASKLVE